MLKLRSGPLRGLGIGLKPSPLDSLYEYLDRPLFFYSHKNKRQFLKRGTPTSWSTLSTVAKSPYDEDAGQLVDVAANDLGFGARIERQSTNLWLRNTDLQNNGSHNLNTATNMTVEDGGSAGVRAGNNYCRLTATANNGSFTQAIAVTNTAYCISCWVRRRVGSGAFEMTLNGSTYSGVGITSGWSRVFVVQTPASPATVNVGLRLGTSGDSVDIDIIQVETGLNPTSEIITAGTAVTRNADALRHSDTLFNSLHNGGSALWVGDTLNQPSSGYFPIFALNNGSALTSGLDLGINSRKWRYTIRNSTVAIADIISSGDVLASTLYAALITWNNDDFRAYVNGSSIGSDTAGSLVLSLSNLGISERLAADTKSGHRNRILVLWDKPFSDAEAKTLTSNPNRFLKVA